VLKRLANFLPGGGRTMLNADLGTYLWRDRYGRHFAWQNEKWIPVAQLGEKR